jgi:hypothetical protein
VSKHQGAVQLCPPATDEEIRASALQFVRKLSGSTRPSKANEAAFDAAVDKVEIVARELIDSLVTSAPARNRELEAAKAKARAAQRFSRGQSMNIFAKTISGGSARRLTSNASGRLHCRFAWRYVS